MKKEKGRSSDFIFTSNFTLGANSWCKSIPQQQKLPVNKKVDYVDPNSLLARHFAGDEVDEVCPTDQEWTTDVVELVELGDRGRGTL